MGSLAPALPLPGGAAAVGMPFPGGAPGAGGGSVGGGPGPPAAGSTWWTRLFQLSECVSLTGVLKGRFDVFGGGWFAAAVVGGVGGPVASGGVLPGDCDLDVDAEQPGEHWGGKFGGEAKPKLG